VVGNHTGPPAAPAPHRRPPTLPAGEGREPSPRLSAGAGADDSGIVMPGRSDPAICLRRVRSSDPQTRPGSSVGTSVRLKIGRSAVRPRPWPLSKPQVVALVTCGFVRLGVRSPMTANGRETPGLTASCPELGHDLGHGYRSGPSLMRSGVGTSWSAAPSAPSQERVGVRLPSTLREAAPAAASGAGVGRRGEGRPLARGLSRVAAGPPRAQDLEASGDLRSAPWPGLPRYTFGRSHHAHACRRLRGSGV
jgi:hypothetical protein